MKEQKVIRDPSAIQLLADETRMKMVYLLRAKEMTAGQLAGELGLTPQTIYHHIKRLKEADMIEVSREERSDHLVESYYRATAGLFHFVDGPCADEKGGEERMRHILKALGELGFEFDPSDKQVSSLVKLREGLRREREDPEVIAKVYDMECIDSAIGRDLVEFAMLLRMDDREFEKYLEAQRTLREWLLSRMTGKGGNPE